MGSTPSVQSSAFVALTLGTFSTGVTSLSVLGLAAGIADDLDDPAGIGAGLVAAYAVAIVIASVVLPMTPVGRTPLVAQAVLGQALMALAAAFCALSSSIAELLVCRTVAGVGSALFGPSCVGLAVLLAPTERRGRIMSWVFAGFTVAPVLGLPLLTWLSEYAGWRLSFGVMCGVAALACVMLLATSWRLLGYREQVAARAMSSVVT